jgi:hypothetical protein
MKVILLDIVLSVLQFMAFDFLQKLDREVGTDGKMLCNDKSSNNPWPDELKSSKGNNSNMTSKVEVF